MRVSERRKRPIDQPNDAAQPNLRRRMAKLIAAFRSTQASDNASILQFKQDQYPHRPRVRARGARPDDTYLIHARDRDFAQHANRGQRVPDVRVIGGSRPGLTKDSREIRRNRGSFMETMEIEETE